RPNRRVSGFVGPNRIALQLTLVSQPVPRLFARRGRLRARGSIPWRYKNSWGEGPMFNSAVLDVVVGLIFVFLVVGLIWSAVVESISGTMKWRSATLLRGIKDLLNDHELTGLAQQLYRHALINPRNTGASATAIDASDQPMMRLWHGVISHPATDLSHNAPSYINPKLFANALIDILNSGPAAMVSG